MNHNNLSGYNGTKDERIWNHLGGIYVTPSQGGNIIRANGHDWMRFENFDKGKENKLCNISEVIKGNIFGEYPLYPDHKSRKDSQPYGKFAGDNSNIGMIYQYRRLDANVTVSDFIDYVTTDVEGLISQGQH